MSKPVVFSMKFGLQSYHKVNFDTIWNKIELILCYTIKAYTGHPRNTPFWITSMTSSHFLHVPDSS